MMLDMTLLHITISLFIHSTFSCQIGNVLYNSNVRYSSNISLCAYPSNESEIISLIQLANDNNASVRAIGKSCSLSAVSMMDNTIYNDLYLLNLSANMTRIIDVNVEEMTMTFEAGLSQFAVVTELEKYNLSISEFGGPLRTNFVGAAMTGTHSWGTIVNRVGTVASNIINLRLITSNGTIINANNTFNKRIFDGSRVSFGALGIVSQVTIQAKPIYYVTMYSGLNVAGLTNLTSMIAAIYDNLYIYYNLSGSESRFHVFKQSLTAKRDIYVDINNDDDPNIYNHSCWGTNVRPCTDVYYTAKGRPNWSQEPSLINVNDASFYVDENVWLDAYIGVVRWIINENKLKNTSLWRRTYHKYLEFTHDIMIGVRFIKEDDIWLSPAYKKNISQISVHYQGNLMDGFRPSDSLFDEWVSAIYNVLKQFDDKVRFHWGKYSMSSYVDLKQSYPMMDEFISLQTELDPNKIFVNKFMIDKLGLCDNNKQCCCTNYTCSVETKCAQSEKDNDDWIWITIVVVSTLAFILFIVFTMIKCKRRKDKINHPQNVTYMTMMATKGKYD